MGQLIVSAAQMRALDREVIDEVGVPGVVLMDAAGRGVAEVIASLVDAARAHVVVYAGSGNNGGDGFVAARHLANRGARVEVIACAPEEKVSGDARIHLEACRRSQVTILDGTTPEALAQAGAHAASAGVVVDALFGTGLGRPVTGHLASAIAQVNAHAGIKVAVDVPSGLDSDRGVPLGACVKADHTVTFAFAKRGLVGAPGFTYAGRLHLIDIGIPERLARARDISCELLDDEVLAPLADRDPLGHKGTHGHLLVLAGSTGKTGAALLCGRAALRAGAGLVTVVAPRSARAALDGRTPELMTAWYGSPDPHGDQDAIDPESAFAELEPLLSGKRALACGPGLPTSPAMRPLLAKLIEAALGRGLALVLDADALNHLAAAPELARSITPEARVILTPHPGEAGRLLGIATSEVQGDRYRCAAELAARYRAVVALKGARTVVAAPPSGSGERLAICPTGNPGLGTGGTGDVLTGAVGALLSRGLGAFEAATAAVYLHGAAGDRVSAERGEIGMVAGDVAEALPFVIAERVRPR
jgi:NAD(P)H-hydrate epimerase